MERDGWKCRVCKRRSNLHTHHIIFRSQKGGDYSWNMLTLCNDCHNVDGVHQNRFIIVAKSGNLDDPVNADEGVKIIRLNGWKPKRERL